MDRYVLVIIINLEPKKECSFNGVDESKKVYDNLKNISNSNFSRSSPFPACSLSGSPAPQRWCFAIQASFGTTQWCSSEWEELCSQRSDSEESELSALDSCITALQKQEEQSALTENPSHAELFEEAAEGLHQLADKLPPPGKSLLDVIVLCVDEEVGLKDMLPVIGSLKHMRAWHSAQMIMVTEHSAGWQKAALYLDARLCSPSVIHNCVDGREIWRGGLHIREKKFVSELKFEGFCLRAQRKNRWSDALYPHTDPQCHTDHKLQHEVFQCYQPVLELIQLVRVKDLPILLHSSAEFELGLTSKSVKAKLLLDQLCTLRGEVGALFSLSCVISTETFPAASQLSSCKWRDFMSKRPKDIPVPDVEVKGERGHYLFLVQGAESGSCTAQMIHTANQINGAAALATLNALIREKVPPSSGSSTADWLRSLPCLRGEQFLQRERKLANVQTLVLKECCRQREEAQKPAAIPVNELKALLNLAREQYLEMHDSILPRASERMCLEKENQTSSCNISDVKHCARTEWPERTVLQNYENIQRARQRSRCRLFSSGSSESLMGPKDSQRGSSTLLDARELLKHFTPDGLPSGELQPLPVLRGEHAFQLSPDLTPRKVTKLPFSKAARSHYHGIEFCLDERKALERDRGFVKLQSRLIRYETQSTCCKEPCPVPFALSPAPSPAVLSEPGSVPDGEALHSEPPRLKRCSRETDLQPHKRFCKSESSESLGAGGTHPAVGALRQQAAHSRSSSGLARRSVSVADPSPSQKPSKTQTQTESRSQKHNRMLREVVAKTLNKQGISSEHKCFEACSQRLFDISKFYLKDLKTSRGLHEEMKKAASNNAKQVIDWVVEKSSKR
ncbi:mdm2-binding protein-like isoform X2 [Sinocyclocheilus rhinocerous]|uniref:Mdm2-binding protein-like n=1 Tax=Sinocyclocheilus rhinocerous TaxID=307959 RepID=A0A673G6M2_9TELE|nr:PREDICTED: mdm2-binding protein-like isoform X1 [Sinocyclocheilus rhinocerous]XP_016366594.1 PREDICTED: mdm2-binding protein-like isoform X2 [Sinocyclocheilus rhinocerous]